MRQLADVLTVKVNLGHHKDFINKVSETPRSLHAIHRGGNKELG